MDSAQPVEEVVVRGKTREPGEISASAEEVRLVPGAFGDAFRAVDALPGNSPTASGIPYFFVRGAPPGNSGYFIDGVRVPLLYHVAIGPSVIHPGLIERVNYYPGGAPAQFGRLTGGVLSADTREPSARARLDANVRLFDAGALVESPFANGDADALAAARYSYTAAALSIFSPNVRLGYWDYQTRAGWRTGDHDRLSVFVFGSHDYRGPLSGLPSTFAADFHRVDTRWDHALGAGSKLRLAATLGTDSSSNEQGSASAQLAGLRLEIDERIDSSARFRGGADVTLNHFNAAIPAGSPTPVLSSALADVYPEHQDLAAGVHADVIWRPTQRVELVPGVRADLYEWRRLGSPPTDTSALPTLHFYRPTTAIPALDPRIAARWQVVPRVAIISSVGLFHQGPGFVVPVPGVQPAGFQQGLQEALQRSTGLEVALPADVTAGLTGYWHEYRNMTAFTTCDFRYEEIDVASGCVDARTRGRGYGLELLIRRPLTRRLGGWISYTLSRSEQGVTTIDARRFTPVAATIPSQFDRPHVLNVVGAYDFGRGWRAGARFVYLSGQPYYVTFQGGQLATPGAIIGPYSVGRLPDFYRIDVRLEKRWRVLGTGFIAVVLEGLNVTLQREAVNVGCSPSLTMTSLDGRCSPVMGDPIAIPSIGVEASL
jgi:hypothetical protein